MIIRIEKIQEQCKLIKNEYALLNVSQKVKFDKMNTEKKEESLLGRALVRQIFEESGFIGKLYFRKTNKGKPFTVPRFKQFSISHSQGIVAACVSDNKVGIDIEVIREIDLNLSKKVCTEEENQWIFAADSHNESIKRFFILWTLKEAYMKVTGEGMRIPFKSIPFKITDDYTVLTTVKEYDFMVKIDGQLVISTAEMR